MSNKLKILALVILAGAFTYKACKKEDGVYADANKTRIIADFLPGGNWRISFFKLNGLDRTADFKEDKFRFERNKTVIVSNGLKEEMGIWSIGANDDPRSFSIEFKDGIPLSLVNGDWDIKKADKSELMADRQGKARTSKDVLAFEKIVEIKISPVPSHVAAILK